MKKIIAVFDGSNFSDAAISFLDSYQAAEKPLVVGVFLSSSDYSYLTSPMMSYAVTMIEEAEVINTAIMKFEKKCKEHSIRYKVHNDSGPNALSRLQLETRFTDLLIVASDLFYKDVYDEEPNEHLYTILKQADCPILLLPEHSKFPKQAIFTYDSKSNSVFALKQFSYLFPEFRDKPATLVYIDPKSDKIPYQEEVEELAHAHFPNCALQHLDFSAGKYLDTWLADREDTIVVSGGFGDKGIFSTFHTHFLSKVIKHHRFPLFIAHN